VLRKNGSALFSLYLLVLPLPGGEEPAYAGEMLPDWYNTLNVSRAILGTLAIGGLSHFLTQALAWHFLTDTVRPAARDITSAHTPVGQIDGYILCVILLKFY
jgi:hypothetical protein